MIQQIQPTSLVPATASQEPRFLRENWKLLLAADCREELRYVRISRGVANITNGAVLLRCVCKDVDDGFYLIHESGMLVNAKSHMPPWMGYPDVEACNPDFTKLAPSPAIPNEVVRELVGFTEFVRREAGGRSTFVVMSREGLYSSVNSQTSFALPLQNLPTGNEAVFTPLYLKMVLVEMLRYPEIYISRPDAPGLSTPVVFGRDWGHCAIIKPNNHFESYSVATQLGGNIHYN